MGDDQPGAVGDGLVGHVGGDGQAGHDAAALRLPIAQQQADVVPVGGQVRECKALQELHNGGNGDHGG